MAVKNEIALSLKMCLTGESDWLESANAVRQAKMVELADSIIF